MEQKLQSKFMAIRITDSSIRIHAADSMDEINHSFATHTMEDATVHITSEDITIEGVEYFRRYLYNLKLEDADKGYEFTEDDIEERQLFKCEKPKGFFRVLKKAVDIPYKVKYLKTGHYMMKQRMGYHLVSNKRWSIEFSKGDVLSSEELAYI